MNASQMLCHIADQMRCALGDIPVTERPNPLRNRVLRLLIVFAPPWPKGRIPTAPEMKTTPPAGWEEDQAAVHQLLLRAAERGERGDWSSHPAFGRLSGREWGWLIYRHMDHHLRQFGV